MEERIVIDKGAIAWKSAFLAVTTIALIPILLYQHKLAASVYVIFLAVVHLGGLVVFAWGVKKEHFQRGLWIRVAGLVILTGLLYLASKGLQATDTIFWLSLGAIWLLHTLGLFLLHARKEPLNCPFV